jgi:hypothetical protein
MDRKYDTYTRKDDAVEEGELSRNTEEGQSSQHYPAAPPVRGDNPPSRDPRQYDDHQQYRRDYRNDHAEEEERECRLPPANQLRLVKLASDVLAEEQKVAIIDGRNEGVSIGRDRSFTARIRCPSMEISKHHANIFKMSSDRGGRKSRDMLFAVADTGSTHGTYILLDSPPNLTTDALPPITAFERLSPPKKASIPKALRHLSLLKVGKTIFQAHLHPGWCVSCEQCALSEDGSNEIPLFVQEKKDANVKSSAHVTPVQVRARIAAQQAIRELKSRHLGDEAVSEPSQSDYFDRAAARRARGGAPATSTQTAAVPAKAEPISAPIVSVPAAKLDATNKGFQMFSSMSGKSGPSTMASHDPILARGVEGRAGLGSKRLLDVQEMGSMPSGYSAEAVRERQRRRFEEAR